MKNTNQIPLFVLQNLPDSITQRRKVLDALLEVLPANHVGRKEIQLARTALTEECHCLISACQLLNESEARASALRAGAAIVQTGRNYSKHFSK